MINECIIRQDVMLRTSIPDGKSGQNEALSNLLHICLAYLAIRSILLRILLQSKHFIGLYTVCGNLEGQLSGVI